MTSVHQARPSKNKDIPHPGRIWYDGQWRTPEQVERRREQHREKMRKRRQDPDYVARENAEARERMKRSYRKRLLTHIPIRWKPKREDLIAAAEFSDELMELVMQSLREDRPGFGAGYARGLGKTLSLDSPVFDGDDVGSWHEVHGDPTHWREPGYVND